MMDHKVPDWKLERYLLGELPPEEMSRLREEITGSPVLAARVEGLEQDNRDFFNRFPSLDAFLPRRQERTGFLERIFAGWHSWWKPLVPAMGLLALFFIAGIPGGQDYPDGHPGYDGVRIKGLNDRLTVYREIGHRKAERLKPGSPVCKDDRLQLSYTVKKGSYGMILSIDGRGAVTLHYPERKSGSTKIIRGREKLLPRDYTLDDAPSFERFYMIISDQPINTGQILRAASRMAKNRTRVMRSRRIPGAGGRQLSVLLRKVPK